jgi:hypothetical protein
MAIQHSPAALRALAIRRLRERLVRDSFPRVQMALLVALTGGCGLLASYTLLQFGFGTMALRYPLALLLAYVFFIFLLWLWLRTNAEDYIDAADLFGVVPDIGSINVRPEIMSGKGGTFDGGGASGDYESPMTATDDVISDSFGSVGKSAGNIAEADELAIPIIVIALAVGIALASLYVVYIAPVLFAEMLVDGALSYALFRHLRGRDPQHWLSSTFRRTAIPFLLTGIFLSGTGAAMSAYAPGAVSVGQVVKHANSTKVSK